MAEYKSLTHPTLLSEHAARYTQPEMIADELVAVLPTDTKQFKYPLWQRRDSFRITDAKVSPTGMPNQRSFTRTLVQVDVVGFSLMDRFALTDTDDAAVIGNLEQDTTLDIAGDLLLGHEQRVINVVTAAANFATANKVTLGTQWTNYTSSTPVKDIQTAIRTCLVKPNKMAMDKVSWDALAAHPDIITGLRGVAGTVNGLASKEEVARFFGLDQVLVAEARWDSANPGATESLGYLWPQGIVVVGRFPDQPQRNDIGFARTYRYRPDGENGITVTMDAEPIRGTRGTVAVKVAYEEVTVVVGNDVGYRIQNAA